VRVVFFGTPEFAVPSLNALIGEGFDVIAVVTQPDRPHGRSRSLLEPPPVKTAALAEGVPVLQPERPVGDAFHRAIKELNPDIGVVVAYGHILKPELLGIPPRGMVNVHPSLLPELRGAAPVEWAILRGTESTGVTIMVMEAGMDSGPILHQIPHSVQPGVTGGELSLHLAEVGAQALVEALALWEQEALRPVPQDHTKATFAPKLTRELARIDWTKPADQVARVTLALDPKPGAWTTLGAHEIKLFRGVPTEGHGTPGDVLVADGRLVVATGTGALEVEEVQPSGKARMGADEWIRGRGVGVGQKFA
jgi:methionyl-tRNA formyltransferase